MKKHILFFSLLSALLFSIALFNGCQDRDTALPDAAETPAVTDRTTPDPDATITGRVPCIDATECTVTVTVTAGAGDFTICGMNDTGTACSDSNSCGSINANENSYTGATSVSFCVTQGRRFNIKNDGTGTLTVDIDTDTGSGPNGIDITTVVGFEADTDCEVTQCF